MRAMRTGLAALLPLAMTVAMGSWVAAAGTPELTEIRAAHHPGFDRIVFEFEGPVPDTARVKWAKDLRLDPSHQPAHVEGDAFLHVRFFPALAHDPKPPHDSTFGSARRDYALPNIGQVVLLGDAEGEVSFGIGLKEKTRILRATTLERPSRLVMDVATVPGKQEAEPTPAAAARAETAVTTDPLTGSAVGVVGQDEDESLADPEATVAGAAAGSFSAAESLEGGRTLHTATPLPDGRVLIIGGAGGREGEPGPLGTAVLWDPSTGSFSQTGSMVRPRAWHSATLLSDGRVLVIGGADGNVPAELWDPVTGLFSPSGMPTVGRTGHTATLLSDGRVLVAGGYGGRGLISHAGLWDPATGSFTKGGMLQEVRAHHTATLLSDGRVLLIAGDADGVFRDSAELWDPITGSFGRTSSLAGVRERHTATLLPDGQVLVVGGLGWDEAPVALASTELWDPVTGTFGPVAPLSAGRAWHAAALLPSGQVLVVGGARVKGGDSPDFVSLASAELLDPVSGVVTPAGNLAEARTGHTATLGPDGCVLVVGGGPRPFLMDGSLASAEMWCPHG